MSGTRIASRFSLATMLGAGFAVVWIVVSIWLLIGLSMMISGSMVSKYPMVDNSGRILIQEYNPSTQQRKIVDLEGKNIPQPDGVGTAASNTWVPPDSPKQLSSRRQASVYSFTDQKDPKNYWYFVMEPSSTDETTGIFVGYHSRTRKCIGYLGRGGFTKMKPARDDQFAVSQYEFQTYNGIFPASGSAYPSTSIPNWGQAYQQGMGFPPWVVYMWSKPNLVRINFRSRMVEQVFESDSVSHATRYYKPVPVKSEDDSDEDGSGPNSDDDELQRQPAYSQKLMIALQDTDRFILFDPANHSTTDIVLPESLRESDSTFTLYQTPHDQVAMLTHIGESWNDSTYYEAIRFDSDGKITKKHERLVVMTVGDNIPAELAGIGMNFALPSPLVISTLAVAVIPSTIPAYQKQSYSESLGDVIGFMWLGMVLLFAVSAYLAYITLKRERRFHSEYPMVSVAFVFLFGWFGYIGYRLHRRWPTEKTITPAELERYGNLPTGWHHRRRRCHAVRRIDVTLPPSRAYPKR